MVCQKLSLYNDNWCCEDILQWVSIQDSSSWLDIIVDIFPLLRPASYLPWWWLPGRRSQITYSPRTTISSREVEARTSCCCCLELSRLTWSLVWNNTEHCDITAGISSCCGNGTELRTAGQKMLVRTQLGRNQRTPHTRPHTSTDTDIQISSLPRYGRK